MILHITRSLKLQNKTAKRLYSKEVPPIIHKPQLQTIINEKQKQKVSIPIHIIDVREIIEIESTGLIPTAKSIPLGSLSNALQMKENEFESKWDFKKPKENDEMIFYCRSGRRSEEACRVAISLGYKDAKNYNGSANEWFKKD